MYSFSYHFEPLITFQLADYLVASDGIEPEAGQSAKGVGLLGSQAVALGLGVGQHGDETILVASDPKDRPFDVVERLLRGNHVASLGSEGFTSW